MTVISSTPSQDETEAKDDRVLALEEFQRAFGEFGGVERRYAHIGGLQTRDNGDPDSLFSATGQAIVFNRYSLDLGGFKEEIAPDAVREAMDAEDADYHLLWDHDTTLVLARNRNGTLNADITDAGVDFWARVAKTSYAADLRVLMDRGDVDECSFAFTIADGGEEWRMEDDGSIVRRVTKIERLWDLTICARGAYPQTHSATARSAVSAMAQARAVSAGAIQPTEAIAPSEERALQPGLVAWQDERGYQDIACDIECLLQEGEDDPWSVSWWVIDLNVRDGGQEAIVCRYEWGEGGTYFLIDGITYDSNDEPVLPDPSTFQGVTVKWVAVATEVVDIEDEGEGVVIVLDSASPAHERIQRLMEAADLKAAVVAELEARNVAPEAETVVEELPAEEATEEPATEETEVEETEETEETEEIPAEDEPATDETEETEVEETEETEETETEALSEDDTDTETAEQEDEELKRKAALARARGRAALV